MSKVALEYAASLWLAKGDTNRDGALDADEFVRLYLRYGNIPL